MMSWLGISWRVRLVLLATALIAAVVPVEGVLAGGDVQEAAQAQSQAAVASAVQLTGAVYAGDCASTESPRDVGAVCSKFVGLQGGVYAFETGMTFSEYTRWIFVQQTGSGWQVIANVPLDDSSATIPWPAAAVPAAPAG